MIPATSLGSFESWFFRNKKTQKKLLLQRKQGKVSLSAIKRCNEKSAFVVVRSLSKRQSWSADSKQGRKSDDLTN